MTDFATNQMQPIFMFVAYKTYIYRGFIFFLLFFIICIVGRAIILKWSTVVMKADTFSYS